MESLDDLQHFTRVTLPSLKLTEQYLVLRVFALVLVLNGRLSPGSKVRPLCVCEREREREREREELVVSQSRACSHVR